MRVLIVIALLVWAAFLLLFVVADVARDLLRNPFHAPPDLDGSEDWDVAADAFNNSAQPASTRGDGTPGRSNALDDLRSAL
jgi:hypothetical protein